MDDTSTNYEMITNSADGAGKEAPRNQKMTGRLDRVLMLMLPPHYQTENGACVIHDEAAHENEIKTRRARCHGRRS